MTRYPFRTHHDGGVRTAALSLAREAVGSSHPYDENMRGEKAWDFSGSERLGRATDRIRTGAERIFPSRECTTDEALFPDSQLRLVNMIGGHLGLLGLEPAHMEQIASHLGEVLALEPYATPRRSRQIDRRPAPTSPRP